MNDNTRRCGHLKGNGEPCQAILWSPGVYACGHHETDVDRARRKGWQEGRDWGHDLHKNAYEDGRKAGRNDLLREQADKEREAERQRNWRETTADGMQIVRCGRGYAYIWPGETPLSVGDRVRLPGNWLFSSPFEDEVTGLGSDYQGPLSWILDVIEKASV